jgi:hypothetical protein
MLTFGIDVYGKEGVLGKFTGIVVQPSREVEWLAVSRKGFLWDHETHLIELKHLVAQDKGSLRLNLTEWDLSVSRTFLRLSDRQWGVPVGMVLLSPGMPVRGIDGYIGRLKGVAWDAERHCLTQLLLKGEWLLGQDWVVPVAWVDAWDDKGIHLNHSRRTLQRDSSQSTPIARASSGA